MPMILNGTGDITGLASVNSSVSAAEIGYLDGVTSALQTQINSRASYESSTFTPIAYGSGTAGTPAYTIQVGQYAKIGRLVFFAINIAWSSFTGSTGNLRIGGLPYSCLSQNWCAISVYPNDLAWTSSQLGAYVDAGNTQIVPVSWNTSGGISEVAVDTAVSRLMLTGFYFAS